MPNERFDDISERYEREIREAANRDQIARAADMLKGAGGVAQRSKVVATLKSLGIELEGCAHPETRKPLSERDKDQVVARTAQKLGLPRPERLRFVMKQASVDNATQVVEDIEEIINSLK